MGAHDHLSRGDRFRHGARHHHRYVKWHEDCSASLSVCLGRSFLSCRGAFGEERILRAIIVVLHKLRMIFRAIVFVMLPAIITGMSSRTEDCCLCSRVHNRRRFRVPQFQIGNARHHYLYALGNHFCHEVLVFGRGRGASGEDQRSV